MRTHFGVKQHMYHATIYLRACALSGRIALAESEFRYWLRVFEKSGEKNLPTKAAKLKEKYRDNDAHVRLLSEGCTGTAATSSPNFCWSHFDSSTVQNFTNCIMIC
jgi:hypothetical protein